MWADLRSTGWNTPWLHPTHHPACTLSVHRAIRSNMFLFRLAWGKKKKKKGLDNHPIGIKCKPKNPISTKQRSNLNLWSHSFHLVSCPGVWHPLSASVYNWVFAVPCNSYHRCVAIRKVTGQTVVYLPIQTDCQYLLDLGQIQH